MELSTDKILDAVVSLVQKASMPAKGRVLDVGSGTGALLTRLRRMLPGVETSACDYTDSLMALQGQKVDVANLNEDRLPYFDNSFDLVTCTEVIEHLENYRRLVRETARVLRPGGAVVFSTPNVLNLQSRLRFLWFGFSSGPCRLVELRRSPLEATSRRCPISISRTRSRKQALN